MADSINVVADEIASRYIENKGNCISVSIDKLRSTESKDEAKLAIAKRYMEAAENRLMEKREPLEVIDRGDGTYAVIDGNNTLYVLRELGAQSVPVIVRKPYQKGVTNIESLYSQAEMSKPGFDSLLLEFQERFGGEIKQRNGLKGMERTAEKAECDYDGAICRVTDILAGSLVFKNEADLMKAFKEIIHDSRIISFADRWNHIADDGYRDVKFNVRLKSGHIAEVQLQHEGIQYAKNMLGHDLYKFSRKLPPHQDVLNKVWEVSRLIYEAGLNGELQVMDESRMASASEIVRQCKNHSSMRGLDPVTLLNDLSGIILNTSPLSSVEKITPSFDSKKLNANLSTSFEDNIINQSVDYIKGDTTDSKVLGNETDTALNFKGAVPAENSSTNAVKDLSEYKKRVRELQALHGKGYIHPPKLNEQYGPGTLSVDKQLAIFTLEGDEKIAYDTLHFGGAFKEGKVYEIDSIKRTDTGFVVSRDDWEAELPKDGNNLKEKNSNRGLSDRRDMLPRQNDNGGRDFF